MTKTDDTVYDYIRKMRDALDLGDDDKDPGDEELALMHAATVILAVDIHLRSSRILAGSVERSRMAAAIADVQQRHTEALIDRRGFPVINEGGGDDHGD